MHRRLPSEPGSLLVSMPAETKRPTTWGLFGLALLILAFPPFDLWFCALLAPWPLGVSAAASRSGAGAFWRFTLLGVGVLLGISWWLAETSLFNLAVVTVVEAPIFGLFGWAGWRVLRQGASVFPALPVLWTGNEMIRMNWPETGYPWALLGQALAANPILVQVADLGGVLAVSFVCASAAAALWAQVSGRPGRGPALVVVSLAILYGFIRPATLPEPEAGPLVATIQPGFDQQLKDRGEAASLRWERCFGQVAEIAQAFPEADLVVFPETMWPFSGNSPYSMLVDQRSDAERLEDQGPVSRALAANQENLRTGPLGQLKDLFKEQQTHWLLGAPALGVAADGSATLLNSAFLYGPDGARGDRYDKVILIPGGEYVPFRNVLPEAARDWLDRMIRAQAGFVPDVLPGAEARVIEVPLAPGGSPQPIGVTICFENAYGDYNRKLVAQGARFLVNLSNEGWFGTSPEFDHMELHSVLRAVETRRALFRSTNTGISCLVRPDGSRPSGADRLEVEGADRGVAGIFGARVPLYGGSTLYMLWGDALGWACLAGSVALLFAAGRRSSRPSVP
ncbi:MAG: apolipoprotein N-acyltransferase [Planctomycetota bacterium]|nr:apolipoprotein N-acyltransferase [Planctomycetota bacterium]